MIKDLVDHEGAECEGQFVPITIGFELADMKKADSPSALRFRELSKHFSSVQEFMEFARRFMNEPHGGHRGRFEW